MPFNMNVALFSGLATWLLGTDKRQRLRLGRTLIAASVFGASMCLQWLAVLLGWAEATGAYWLTGLILCGVSLTYAAIRSGWSLRLGDPALTLTQSLFAIVCLAIAYRLNSPIRGAVLMVVPLVLVFSAFTLRPERCRQLGQLALIPFALAMASGAMFDPARFQPMLELFNFAFCAAVLPAMSILASQLSQMRGDQQRQKRELQAALTELSVVARRDELTGLPNRRFILEWASHELARNRRSGSPWCLAMLDLDHFKRVNDTWGHRTGDDVLVRFAKESARNLRDADFLIRWGGEEFLLAMPDTPLHEGSAVLERLRAQLGKESAWLGIACGPVSFSAGLTEYHPSESFEKIVERADAALYGAKVAGRDRCMTARGADDAESPVDIRAESTRVSREATRAESITPPSPNPSDAAPARQATRSASPTGQQR